MKNNSNGWKVLIKANRQSISNHAYSNLMAIIYPINQKMQAKNNSKLFYFKNKEDADSFVCYDEIVVPCIVENGRKAKESDICRCLHMNEYFWKLPPDERLDTGLTRIPPKGTWVADSITCLE